MQQPPKPAPTIRAPSAPCALAATTSASTFGWRARPPLAVVASDVAEQPARLGAERARRSGALQDAFVVGALGGPALLGAGAAVGDDDRHAGRHGNGLGAHRPEVDPQRMAR